MEGVSHQDWGAREYCRWGLPAMNDRCSEGITDAAVDEVVLL